MVVEYMDGERRGDALERGLEGGAVMLVEVEVSRGGRAESIALGVGDRVSRAMLLMLMVCRVSPF